MRRITLSAEQREELERARDRHPKAYVRERAAAILKVAQGQPVRRVAEEGLLKPRKRHTISRWITRYEQACEAGEDGVQALQVRPGRGRKPAFSPYARDGHGSR